jgi:H2-forming N5,N10-methylenetetrahydromethanopterin dehydrogenase-like enzyme
MEEKGEKLTCECGSVVLKKNLASHIKTKKHQAVTGPPSLHRSTGVSFADAQHTDRADVEDDEGSESDMDDGEDIEELFSMIEELGKAILVMDKKLDSVFDRVEETRLKMNICLGQVREVLMALPNGGVPVVKPQDHA